MPRSWISPLGEASRRISPAVESPSRTPPTPPIGIARRATACTFRLLPLAPADPICRARRSRARCAPAWCSRSGATACCRTFWRASRRSVCHGVRRRASKSRRGANFELGWKQSPRGAVAGARPDESTPSFAEMASPGTVFRGDWDEKTFFLQPEVRKSMRWPESFGRGKIFEAVNIYAAGVLALQRQYASLAGMGLLDRSLDELEQRLAAARQNGTCLISMGWGGGLLAKSAWLDTTNTDYRQILQQFVIYNRALSTNLPFPKTRRIVFLNNRPATLPGWAELAVEE